MEVKVKETFRYEGNEYKKGNVIDLPESVARSVIEKGYGTKIEEESPPNLEVEEKVKERKGPQWKRKIWISEDRNISISVWPSGEKYDSPSITLEESRRDESGNWETNRMYLPTGSSLLALSEHLRLAWSEVQKIRSEKEK